MIQGIQSWGLARISDIPEHAVICYERAAGRIDEWRAKSGSGQRAVPPLCLVKALIHTDTIPTAVGSEADHYWLIALHRWASATELARLFGVPADHPMARALRSSAIPITARQAVRCFGKAVHCGSAGRAIELALRGHDSDSTVMYASACSGIDTVAVALNTLVPGGWRYVFASECDAAAAKLLVASHSHVGLAAENVHTDARSLAATVHAPRVDLWCITPPCEAFSRRNHARSTVDAIAAVRDINAMLLYPRIHRPAAIVVENVDEPETRSLIRQSLLGLEGYEWHTFVSEASEYGPMSRARRFWVGGRAQ